MANPEHQNIIRKGVDEWNVWRIRDYETLPDLSHANLENKKLCKADFHITNFYKANLFNTDLSGAFLHRGNFTKADLRKANLRRAYLGYTDFTGASLSDANLSQARLEECVFINTNLSGAVGLETCVNQGHSTIDHRTLAISEELPLKFLRGCGLPDYIIDNLPVLYEDGSNYYSCFISYSSEDEAFAKRLHADLQDSGVRCWFAKKDMRIGDKIRSTIDREIRNRDKLLLILSKQSIESEWVEKEVETAFEEERRRKETVLFPIRVDDDIMKTDEAWAADIRRTRHIGDFLQWKNHDAYRKVFDELLRELKSTDKAGARGI